ncbi:MAG: hypothetical protein HKP29_13920, partial [Silicimonas sp.]|nr:hypothetical protein [Silicimonas sp.]
RVIVTDATAAEGVLAVMGPKSRDLMARISPADFSSAAFPFGTAREVEVGFGLARAHRVSYVGELGWELYVSADMCAHIFEVIQEEAHDLGPALGGMHSIDSLRIEKAFRHFGHDITPEDHVIDAGLGFAVKTDKPDFIGRDAVLRRKEAGPEMRMVQFLLTDPEPLLYHNEPILKDGEFVGYTSSGAYGHALGAAVGMGYVPAAIAAEDHVIDAGLGFAVKTEKPGFIGRDAVLRRKDAGPEMRMVQFLLTDPEPLLYHNEPILKDGEFVGYTSSGAYGHALGAAVGMGYVPAAIAAEDHGWEIEVAGTRVAARASLRPMYDPKSERMRA